MNDRADDSVLADDELLITRTFDAPVELVFRLWSQREHMMRWLGPTGFQCTSLAMDFRPGGQWRACIDSARDGTHWMGGQYREIEAGRRIVFTFAWDSEDGSPPRETIVTVTLTEEGGKAVQRFHQKPFESVESRDSHVGGWSECFDREVAYAEQLAQGAAS